jgi:hypothetical protein
MLELAITAALSVGRGTKGVPACHLTMNLSVAAYLSSLLLTMRSAVEKGDAVKLRLRLRYVSSVHRVELDH